MRTGWRFALLYSLDHPLFSSTSKPDQWGCERVTPFVQNGHRSQAPAQGVRAIIKRQQSTLGAARNSRGRKKDDEGTSTRRRRDEKKKNAAPAVNGDNKKRRSSSIFLHKRLFPNSLSSPRRTRAPLDAARNRGSSPRRADRRERDREGEACHGRRRRPRDYSSISKNRGFVCGFVSRCGLMGV